MPKSFFSLFFLFCTFTVAEEPKKVTPLKENQNLRPFEEPLADKLPDEIPWIVGNILTGVGFVIPSGHFKILLTNTTRSSTTSYGDNWKVVDASDRLTINTLLNIKVGLTKFMDCFVRFEGVYKKKEQVATYGLGDVWLGTEFQLYRYPKNSWLPAIKLVLSEFFPTGRYQRLRSNKLTTDASGLGSYASEIGLNASHLYHIQGIHYLGVLLDIRCRFFLPVQVHGLNAFGGALNTNGRIYQGQQWLIGQGFQFSISKKWTLATDLRYRYQQKRKFSGFAGGTDKTPATNMSKPSSDQFIFAPQIEYSWTNTVGAIVGSWFTFAGRNTEKYYGAIAQFNYYY